MTENAFRKLNSINLVERFKTISDNFQTTSPMENFSSDEVFQILYGLDNNFIYDRKESIYGLRSVEDGFDIRFNLVLKYGIVETIMWAKNIETKEQYGGTLSRLMKLMQQSNGEKEIIKIRYPRFSSYKDLKSIIKELLVLFEDFKFIVKSD